MAHRKTKQRRRETRFRLWRMRLVFWLGAVLAGLVVTGLVVGSVYADQVFRAMAEVHPLMPFLTLPLGMAAIALAVKAFPGTQGSGIPQAIAALHVSQHGFQKSLLSLKIAFAKVVLVMAGLACGASIGREGPSVHVGASIMYGLRRFVRMPHQDISRGLILTGAAAGLAAAFNTPLAGVVFAIEEMSRSFSSKTTSTVLTGVVLAGIVSLAIQGNYTYFGVTSATIDLSTGVQAVLICGVIGGLLGGLFSRVLVEGGRLLRPVYGTHPVTLAFLCGLIVAVIGWASGGNTYGTGYAEAQTLLSGQELDGEGFWLWKILATLASYWSGIPGGIFAPSLSVGAGLGFELSALIPGATVSAIALLGMAAYFTGVVQTPLTAVIIIMEMTSGSSLLLPLMATALLADLVSKVVCPVPIYEALAKNFMAPPVTDVNVPDGKDQKHAA